MSLFPVAHLFFSFFQLSYSSLPTARTTCIKHNNKILISDSAPGGRPKQALSSVPPCNHRLWCCFLPHIPGAKPYRAVRALKAQFSPELFSQALLPGELGRKGGNRSGNTHACVRAQKRGACTPVYTVHFVLFCFVFLCSGHGLK